MFKWPNYPEKSTTLRRFLMVSQPVANMAWQNVLRRRIPHEVLEVKVLEQSTLATQRYHKLPQLLAHKKYLAPELDWSEIFDGEIHGWSLEPTNACLASMVEKCHNQLRSHPENIQKTRRFLWNYIYWHGLESEKSGNKNINTNQIMLMFLCILHSDAPIHIIPKPKFFGDLGDIPLTFHHHLGWVGTGRYTLPSWYWGPIFDTDCSKTRQDTKSAAVWSTWYYGNPMVQSFIFRG